MSDIKKLRRCSSVMEFDDLMVTLKTKYGVINVKLGGDDDSSSGSEDDEYRA